MFGGGDLHKGSSDGRKARERPVAPVPWERRRKRRGASLIRPDMLPAMNSEGSQISPGCFLLQRDCPWGTVLGSRMYRPQRRGLYVRRSTTTSPHRSHIRSTDLTSRSSSGRSKFGPPTRKTLDVRCKESKTPLHRPEGRGLRAL